MIAPVVYISCFVGPVVRQWGRHEISQKDKACAQAKEHKPKSADLRLWYEQDEIRMHDLWSQGSNSLREGRRHAVEFVVA